MSSVVMVEVDVEKVVGVEKGVDHEEEEEERTMLLHWKGKMGR